MTTSDTMKENPSSDTATSEGATRPIQHGHLDPEANPSYESNVTIHGHDRGDRPHRHPDAPSWGAVGTEYVNPARAERILADDREPGR